MGQELTLQAPATTPMMIDDELGVAWGATHISDIEFSQRSRFHTSQRIATNDSNKDRVVVLKE